MKIAVIKYNAGNIRSVLFALERIGTKGIITDDPLLIRDADKIIFPGVGEAGSAMSYLKKHKLDETIQSIEQPVLCICLGMQLMCARSEEGNTECFRIFSQQVKKFIGRKVPHTGWNTIYGLKGNLFDSVAENSYMYFVHSYYVEKGKDTIAESDYETGFSAAMQKNNFYALQFHPEKSGKEGERILRNFIDL